MKNKYLAVLFILLTAISFIYAENLQHGFSSSSVDRMGDTIRIKESYKEKDRDTNEYLKDRLKPIQYNFKRINSITNWTSIKKQNIEGESAEGGEATYYYKNKRLEKIMARHYGEMGQVLIEYYLLNGNLSFVFEKDYKYNRPLFYDVKAMKENNDTEVFDFEKSEIIETRNYFEKGNLIHIVNSQDCGAPFSGSYMSEEERSIKEDFKRLLKLLQEK
ncbi:hypothetical protein EG359_21240 [Chryseobacterium joostei]|uniref:DUF4468 domain-containing protein n=1 Tax=Chryseobacterium joostei TaxID=112234 RepID=A0A1N7ICW1_9FLAO|nr:MULTISPECIES: hypothetical protein [Chryseobacterium]AZB01958.1 hypothetical protein EG359_21240 [Chryseobacterium joostei]SIS34905.1 hypothetical protein SAMN05421768_104154 [Chryseobacterium joostei]HCM36171.1 hypothetical protein [Chryseobacterium sp.]